MLTALLLRAFHIVYSTILILSSLIPRSEPRQLLDARRKIPSHVALLLLSHEERKSRERKAQAMLESVKRVIDWCRAVGIKQLSVYDREGIIRTYAHELSPEVPSAQTPESLRIPSPRVAKKSDMMEIIQLPPTPPPSDLSESRSLSPDIDSSVEPVLTISIPPIGSSLSVDGGIQQRRAQLNSENDTRTPEKSKTTPLTLNILSRLSSKPHIATVTRSLAAKHMLSSHKKPESFQLTVEGLNKALENSDGTFGEPDLMIVHTINRPHTASPLELDGFPPWQIRLTEISYGKYDRFSWWWSSKPRPIEERVFRRALDDYAGAQMRLGK